MGDAELDDLAFARDALAVEDVEQRLAERRRDLVLDDLDPRLVADDLLAALDGADAADVEADRRVELERVAAGGGFGAAEHHADLHPDLVDEDDQRVGALDVGGELAQRLAHQAGLQAHVRVAHFAFDFGFGGERGDRVDHHHVHAAGTHQHVGDFQRLFAGIGLRNQQVVDVDAEFLRIRRVKCVFSVDERRGAAEFLHFGDDLQRERRLAARLRAVDFDHPAAWQAANAQCDIEPQRSGRYRLNVARDIVVAKAHDRALAELLFDLPECCGKCLHFVFSHCGGGHVVSPESVAMA